MNEDKKDNSLRVAGRGRDSCNPRKRSASCGHEQSVRSSLPAIQGPYCVRDDKNDIV